MARIVLPLRKLFSCRSASNLGSLFSGLIESSGYHVCPHIGRVCDFCLHVGTCRGGLDYTATASDGSTVTGTFGYDTSVPGVPAPDPALDAAVYLAGFWNGTITSGVFDGLDFDYSTVETGVANGVDFIGPIDDVLIVQPNENGLILVDSTATVFSDASLPLMLTLADFNVASIFLDGDDLTGDANNLDEQSYLLTSLTLSPTPIPAPLPAVLLGTAVMALPVFRRRRSAA